MKTRIMIVVLLLAGLCLGDQLYAQQGPWQLRKDQDGIKVYTRKIASSPILEYKADVIMNAPVADVIAIFENEKMISQWYYQCVHSELVDNEGPDQKVGYLLLHLPWPVTARDVVFRIKKSQEPDQGETEYNLTALPDRLPVVKGVIRVPALRSLWRFKTLPQGQTEIYFQQYSDPGGSIPAFLVNEIAVDTPFYSLKNLRSLTAGKRTSS